ncbi:BnaA04g18700D [Brassica napus]|uniref:BnaA04g18700D protein n=1 Tax=Brassica napus TaxID=3708 RepID=A0A078FXL8_BRANA|nr:BnaA04g18700D [Brassica napus]
MNLRRSHAWFFC